MTIELNKGDNDREELTTESTCTGASDSSLPGYMPITHHLKKK